MRRQWSAATIAILLAGANGCRKEPASPEAVASSANVAGSQAPPALFTDAAASCGLDFVHFTGTTGELYFPEIMGAGCALLDYDNDGDLDVYLLQGHVLNPDKTPEDAVFPFEGPLPPRNRLFRNELIRHGENSGVLRFVDVTEASGAGDTGYAMGVATGDYNNDGNVDLYISNFGPDVLLHNNGDGTFTDVTAGAGLGDPRWNTSAAFVDVDNDGFLDLFVTAYCDFAVAANKECFTASGLRDYCSPKGFPTIPGRLYRSRGDGTFEDVSERAGIDRAYGHGLGVGAADFDGNGWMDIYVANDGDANQLWMNRGGEFTDASLMSGTAYNLNGLTEAGMGVAIADLDADGDPDMLLTHLTSETNTFYENEGNTVFEDRTMQWGLGQPSLPFTSFGVGWLDVDHDADLDLFIANGAVRYVDSLMGDAYPYHQTNQFLLNTGDRRFTEITERIGPVIKLSEVSRGTALGDVDNDGDIDVLVSNNNGPVRLLRNELADRGNWIILRVIDQATGRDAYGADVRLTLNDGRVLVRTVRTDGSYCSAGDPRVHFSWPRHVTMKSVRIKTVTGSARQITGLTPGTILTVTID